MTQPLLSLISRRGPTRDEAFDWYAGARPVAPRDRPASTPAAACSGEERFGVVEALRSVWGPGGDGEPAAD